MVPFSKLLTSSNTLCHLPPKPNLTILKELGHTQPPTPIQTDNAMADTVIIMGKSNQNKQKQWACISTGCRTENPNNNSTSSGASQTKLRRLLDKTPLHSASHQHAQRIYYSSYSFRNAEYKTTTNGNQSSIEHCHW
jgi:hypothetical protein